MALLCNTFPYIMIPAASIFVCIREAIDFLSNQSTRFFLYQFLFSHKNYSVFVFAISDGGHLYGTQ